MPDFYIDCAQDFDPDVGIERRNPDTGQYEPYAGITGVTMTLSATRGSATPGCGDPTRAGARCTSP